MRSVWAALIVGLFVLGLRLEGRPWCCACGQFACGGWWTHYSQHLVDRWTWSHFGHGIFFYGLFRGFLPGRAAGLSLLLVLLVEVAWELLENTVWVIEAYRSAGDRLYTGDSVVNSLGDVAACMLGAWITSRIV